VAVVVKEEVVVPVVTVAEAETQVAADQVVVLHAGTNKKPGSVKGKG